MDGPSFLSAELIVRWLDDVEDNVPPRPMPLWEPRVSFAEHVSHRTISDVSVSFTDLLISRITPVWRVEHHPDEWEAVNNFNAVHIEEACTDGLKILREVNPEEYQMSTETRVVCIKTQFVENMQIGIKNNLWCTSDKVGEKISLVWREHDPSREKVLLLFSIAKQRAYCALGEMTGPWEQTPSAPSGWIEKQGSFEILGNIPVTFTHIKNVSNDSFSRLNDDSGQPITNMWNGMHFRLDKGVEVVKIYHEKAHFTNILAYDKRKSYRPNHDTENSQELDPRLHHRYMRLEGRPTATRGGPASRGDTSTRGGRGFRAVRAITNWRQPNHEGASMPTSIRNRGQGDRTPTQARTSYMQRDHAPSPLDLSGLKINNTPKQSPRPGQMFITDMNGNLVPLPSSATVTEPLSTPRTVVEPSSTPHTVLSGGATPRDPTPRAQSPYQVRSMGFMRGQHGGRGGFGGFSNQSLRHQSSSPQLSGETMYEPPDSQHPLRHSRTVQDLAGHDRTAASDSSGSTALLRKVMPFAYPPYSQDQIEQRNKTAQYMSREEAMKNPEFIARHAKDANHKVLPYESMRRQALSSAGGSFSSTLPSEWNDWASTSQQERDRIGRFSPLSGASDRYPIDSTSKGDSPTSKQFHAAVNREIRTMRQGQRAMPMLPAKQADTRPFIKSYFDNTKLPSDSSSPVRSATSHSMHGGVSLSADPSVADRYKVPSVYTDPNQSFGAGSAAHSAASGQLPDYGQYGALGRFPLINSGQASGFGLPTYAGDVNTLTMPSQQTFAQAARMGAQAQHTTSFELCLGPGGEPYYAKV